MVFSRQKIFFILLILNAAILAIICWKYCISFLPTSGGSLNLYAFYLFYSIFYFVASTTFLILWINHQDIFKGIPDTDKHRWFGPNHQNDDTMLLLAAAILCWQFKTAISFFDQNSFGATISMVACSTINSALFLQVTTYFRFALPAPSWTTHPFLKRWFQQPAGIWLLAGLTAILTVLLSWGVWEKPDKRLMYLADVIFSLTVVFFLFRGLWRLFDEREMSTLRFLIVVTFILTAWTLKNYLEGESESNVLNVDVYIQVGYRMSIIALSFALIISYHSSLRKLFSDEKNRELEEKNRELKLLRQEVSHRVKNHLRIISLSVERQMSKYDSQRLSDVISELQAVRARTNAILAVHELLYNSDPQEANLHSIVLLEYLSNLLSRLRDSFSYPPSCFQFHLNLSKDIFVKSSIAPQIGMLITELALNVDQHAYQDTEIKYINIRIAQENEQLSIVVQDHGQESSVNPMSLTGQGLSIIKAITEQFDGTFQLQNTHPGIQADISFFLKNLL